jgi:hydroxymethylglutaryl-CoA reductase (NADPH)
MPPSGVLERAKQRMLDALAQARSARLAGPESLGVVPLRVAAWVSAFLRVDSRPAGTHACALPQTLQESSNHEGGCSMHKQAGGNRGTGAGQILGVDPKMRRTWLQHNTGHALSAVTDTAFAPEEVGRNIENLVGAAHVPLGIAGPIRVNGEHAQGSYYVPFATTEGTLVSTYQYGMRAITEAGGANAHVLGDSLDITPCFELASAGDAIAFSQWLNDHLEELRGVAAETTSHGRLTELHTHVFGRRVFARFVFTTGDAMGMNMVNIAVDQVCRHAAEMTRCERYYLRCNYSSDKKPAAINLFRPYGKEVAIDCTLPASVVETYLGVSTRELLAFVAAGRLGAMQAGVLGMNAHFANGLAAIYIACGQDVAQVVNASIGFIETELVGEDDLYVSARLPNLVVGTVGGGTRLPTQKECLALLDCDGDGKARKFAEIVAATVVAGDLAIGAALANGRFIEAHRQTRKASSRAGKA